MHGVFTLYLRVLRICRDNHQQRETQGLLLSFSPSQQWMVIVLRTMDVFVGHENNLT